MQLLIPSNTFHTARVIGQRRWFLGASTEWPGVEKIDVEIGNVEALAAKYPDVADDLRAFQQRVVAIDLSRLWMPRLRCEGFGRARLPSAPKSSRRRLNPTRGTLSLPPWQSENAQAN